MVPDIRLPLFTNGSFPYQETCLDKEFSLSTYIMISLVEAKSSYYLGVTMLDRIRLFAYPF
jgi:hypothetical protein